MDLPQYIAFLRRRWWLVLAGPVLAMAAAFAVSSALTRIYEANARLLVVNQTGASAGSVIQLNDILTTDRLSNTYVQLVTSRSVMQGVIDSLKLPVSVDQLTSKVKVSVVDQTQLLQITVADPHPALAADIANETAKQFIAENARELGRPGTVTVAEPATPPLKPSKPAVKTNIVIGAVLGLMLATAFALTLDYLDDTIKSPEDIEAIEGLTSLGVVGRFQTPRRRPANREEVMRWIEPVTEDYRDLRTNLHFINIESKMKTLVITSHGPGEGKSTTAANLAMVLAQSGDRVILVDTDLRRPTLHHIIGASNSFGLTGLLLTDAADPVVALARTNVKNLLFLASGPVPPNPSELLSSKRMAGIIRSLAAMADYVIFDSPPISTVSDAGVIAGEVDGVLLVVEARKSRAGSLKHSLRALTHVKGKIVGAMLNKQRTSRRRYGYQSYSQQVFEAADLRIPGSGANPNL